MTRRARVEALLRAAVEVVAVDGLRGLTHRAVDVRAGLPAGSTSFYFRTRQALLAGMIEFIADRDQADIEEVNADAAAIRLPQPVRTVHVLTEVLLRWLGPARSRTRVRMEVLLLAEDHPELAAAFVRISDWFLRRARAALRDAGAPHPERGAKLMRAMLEGILYDGLVRPTPPRRAALRRSIEAVVSTAATQ